MIDREEQESFYVLGDKMLEDYNNFFKRVRELKIEHPKIREKIDNLIEVMSNDMKLLSLIMDNIDELEMGIEKDIQHPYLQSIDAIRKIKEYIKDKRQEYLLRVSMTEKLKECLLDILDRYEDYENACREAGLDVKEIGPEERLEMGDAPAEEGPSEEEIINKLAELVDEYKVIKENQEITKKRVRLDVIKKRVRELGEEDWIKEEFEKNTGDAL